MRDHQLKMWFVLSGLEPTNIHTGSLLPSPSAISHQPSLINHGPVIGLWTVREEYLQEAGVGSTQKTAPAFRIQTQNHQVTRQLKLPVCLVEQRFCLCSTTWMILQMSLHQPSKEFFFGGGHFLGAYLG